MLESIMFYITAAIVTVSALSVIVSRRAIYSAISLIIVMVGIAFFFIMQQGGFVAMIQILVYAGAIMVLFVFVVMMLNIEEKTGELTRRTPLIQVAIAGIVLFFISIPLGLYSLDQRELPQDFGSSENVATFLYTANILPFEIASILLIVGLVGAVILTKKG